MQRKSKIAFGSAAAATMLGVVLLASRQCYSYTATIGGQYAESQFRAAMATDPSGEVTLKAKFPLWQAEQWTGDEALYEKVRLEIDSPNVPPRTLEALYQLQAENQPHSAAAQFRWAYALWKRIALEQPSSKRTSTLSALFYTLAKVDSPNTYNYARLRYLTEPSSKDTSSFGERLLKQEPQDDEIKLSLIGDYAFNVGASGNPLSKARALDLCHQLLQTDPKRARYYAVLGTVYEMSYTYKHNASDSMKSVAADQKYISLVDPQSEYARMRCGAVAELKADLAKDNQ